MRAAVRIVPNKKGIAQMLRSPGVEAELRRRAERIAAAAGEGHRVDSQSGPNRARAAVITDSIPAMIRERKRRNLTRSFDAGRG